MDKKSNGSRLGLVDWNVWLESIDERFKESRDTWQNADFACDADDGNPELFLWEDDFYGSSVFGRGEKSHAFTCGYHFFCLFHAVGARLLVFAHSTERFVVVFQWEGVECFADA